MRDIKTHSDGTSIPGHFTDPFANKFANFRGNVIPSELYKQITNSRGKADLNAIVVLSEILYWNRPNKNGERKFRGDAWQTSYDFFCKKFGFSKETIRRILVRLEELSLVSRELRTIEHYGQKYNNVLFLHLNIGNLQSSETVKKICKVDVKVEDPSPQIYREHYKEDKENKKRENRSKKLSAFLNDDFLEAKTFTDFLPISSKDVEFLNDTSGKSFTEHFIKELILKFNTKYPEYKFRKKENFLSYMTKALANEKLTQEKANNTDFKFLTEREKTVEATLAKIEKSTNRDFETLLKKKIVSRFESDVAFELISAANFQDGKLTLKRSIKIDGGELNSIPSWIEDILKKEIESICSNNNHIQSGVLVKQLSKKYQASDAMNMGDWGNIREGLTMHFDDIIDKTWFSQLKLEPSASLVSVKAPTGFIRDWVKSNYGHIIEKEISKFYPDSVVEFVS